MRLLLALYVWTIWLVLGGIIGIPLMVTAITFLSRPRAYAVMRAIVRLVFFLSGVRVVTRGLEQLDYQRSYVMVVNHVNLLDPFFFIAVLPVPVSGVEKQENFRIPLYGWLIRRWGNVPLDRNNPKRAMESLQRCADLLHAEKLWMVLMPEGTRTRDGHVGAFKRGVFMVPFMAEVPVVPVTMNGAFEVQARRSFWARPGVVELVFHAPIEPRTYREVGVRKLAAEARATIMAAYTGPADAAGAVLIE